LPVSIPERITGSIDIMVALADDAATGPQALVELLSRWVRAVEIGFFGRGRIKLQGTIETQGRTVSAMLESEDLSQAAVQVLARMIRYFSNVKGRVNNFAVFYGGQEAVVAGRMQFPAVPPSIPFTVEYPEDLKHYVRIEIEFRNPLTTSERDAIFEAFSIWDAVIEALGDEKRQGRRVDYKSQLLSPAIVEHHAHGYYAPFECLHFIVWLGVRLHRRLAIERLTME
jgi:hypothetical protein